MWGVGGLQVHGIHHNNVHNGNNNNNNTVSATHTQEKSISSPHSNRIGI